MAKKATTIVLVVVVLFLLASTVYVSIILTSEDNAPTTPRNSQASEIEDGTTAVEPGLPPGADPAGFPPSDASSQSDQGVVMEPPSETLESSVRNPAEADTASSLPAEEQVVQPTVDPAAPLADAVVDPATGERVTSENGSERSSQDGDLLAYANPTPVETDYSTGSLVGSPTGSKNLSPSPSITSLPETGGGHQIASASPTSAITAAPSNTLPVAGGLGATVAVVLVAGITIVASLLL
ncbi:MAG: hypothetical protein N2691_01275 [Patescibacteria group bacterium]|nr:hypothetical protein [Patescibacteria group bacterium]